MLGHSRLLCIICFFSNNDYSISFSLFSIQTKTNRQNYTHEIEKKDNNNRDAESISVPMV